MASRPSLSSQPNRAFPSSIPSARRISASAIPISSVSASPSPPKASPNASTPTGIPGFRSLRSLLPFGPHKNATPVSSAVSPSPQVSRSPFAHFGSVRRSMNRERKASLDVDLPPVISIGHPSSQETEVRRSVSCSTLPPGQDEHVLERSSNPFDNTVIYSGTSKPSNKSFNFFSLTSYTDRPILRTPSPGPPITADLSTILEADTSGLSNHIPSSTDPSRPPSPDASAPSDSSTGLRDASKSSPDTDTSILDLSTSHLANDVLNAMMQEDSNTAAQWLSANKAVVIDGETDPSFKFDALDPDLAAILSPHRVQPQSSNIKNLSINSQPPHNRAVIDLSKMSPASPRFTLSPASPDASASGSFLPSSVSPSPLGSLRSRLPRQQSSLPRLRPPLPPSPHSPHNPTANPTASPIMPCSNASDSAGEGKDDTARVDIPRHRHASPSSTVSPSTSAPGSPATTTFSKSIPKSHHSPSLSVSITSSTPHSLPSHRFSSQVHTLSTKNLAPTTPAHSPQDQSSSSSSNTTTIPRFKPSFNPNQSPSSATPPGLLRTTSSSAINSGALAPSLSPSVSPSRLAPHPSIDSTSRGNESFDRHRPTLSLAPPGFGYETPARPSTHHGAGSGGSGNGSGGSASAVLARARKRSMSVQERYGRHLLPGQRGGEDGRERASEDGHGNGGSSEFGELRPSSSLSGRMGRRWEGDGPGGSVVGRPPMTEWLGPRTVKAFKAAGLMDFEREQPQLHERSPGSVAGLGSGPAGTLGRFASMRSTSEYNSRAPSRMAMSEAGGSSVSRRGSGSGAGIGMSYGLMESPTFTASSGSRDTPRSASTAPTSVSGASFGLLSRDRDRDREREDIREMKDKHSTETAALLGALSDSQRTTRVLREENGELRDRLEQVEAENDALRRVVGDLTKEAGELRVQMQMLRTSTSTNSRLAAGTWSIPTRRSGLSTSIRIDQDDDDDWGSHVDGGEHIQEDDTRRHVDEETQRYHSEHLELPQSGPVLSSTPAAHKHRRRFSTTSSIFPVPPPNMTMLMHDNDHSDSASFNGDHGDLDQSQFSLPAAMSTRGGKGSVNGQPHNVSASMSISPTTANFSMTTGSPGSLFLRPEHEMHLGDMESLDLGSRRDGNIAMDDGDWSD
ncbi:hypothetical protein DXG03_007724 [Asterophora parasitica]|uniref:Uncharacterized protein n=1 Tax=Asterophora parasitica TaxID=117018 RepID=A0A9P7GIV0_9AGAR|nr:hypothetical protein DXG03_007724 [Asterophora parasitica]